jgi:hypothetical protein
MACLSFSTGRAARFWCAENQWDWAGRGPGLPSIPHRLPPLARLQRQPRATRQSRETGKSAILNF